MQVKEKPLARGLPTYVYFGNNRSQLDLIALLNLWLARKLLSFAFCLLSPTNAFEKTLILPSFSLFYAKEMFTYELLFVRI